MREGNAERGFTIIELMIVVAIIAVLAAVVIPSFLKETKRGKAKSEVSPVFAELSTREDQYKLEVGSYLAAAACPSTATSAGTDVVSACLGTGQPWTLLRVQPHESKLTCSYTISAGAPGVAPVLPTWVTGVTAQSTTSWFFINAVCPNTEYFMASWDTTTRAKDNR